MRAPPLSVCSGRLSAASPSTLAAVLVPLRERALRGVDELDGLVGEDAGDVLVEIRDDVFATYGVRRGSPDFLRRGLFRGAGAVLKGSGGRRDRRRDWSRGRGAGCGSDCSAARAAATMRFSSSSVACSMRASSAAMRLEVSGGFVEIRGDGLHGIHAVGEQVQLGVLQTHAAVERLADPVFERRGETDAMPRFGHARAAGKRMAGAIRLFADDVRRAFVCARVHVAPHGFDVHLGLAAVDVAQLQVAAGSSSGVDSTISSPCESRVFDRPTPPTRRRRGCRRAAPTRRHVRGAACRVGTRLVASIDSTRLVSSVRSRSTTGVVAPAVRGQRVRAVDDVLGARRRSPARPPARSPVRRRRPPRRARCRGWRASAAACSRSSC